MFDISRIAVAWQKRDAFSERRIFVYLDFSEM